MVFKVISCNGVINSIPSAEVFCLATVFYIESVLIANVPVITNLFLSLNVPFITAIIESRQALFKGLISSLTQVTKASISLMLHAAWPRYKVLWKYFAACYATWCFVMLFRGPNNRSGTWNKHDYCYWLKSKTIFSILAKKALFFSFTSGKRKQN